MTAPRITFNRAIIALGLVAAVWIGLGPLIREQYAKFAWQKIPCHISPEGRYVFEFPEKSGKKYTALEPNLWRNVEKGECFPATADMPIGEINATCWVNGGSPLVSVKELDAWKHLDQGIGHFVGAALILIGSTAVVWVSILKTPKRWEKSSGATVP